MLFTISCGSVFENLQETCIACMTLGTGTFLSAHAPLLMIFDDLSQKCLAIACKDFGAKTMLR